MNRFLIKIKYGVWCVLIVCCACGGNKKKTLLDREQFTALLIDMHTTDGLLSINRGFTVEKEKKNYTYYNGVFEKYGITKADFDSCMYFYASQPQLFSEIYHAVIDSLSHRVTVEERVLQKLRANDSVNYYKGPDTLVIDTFPFTYKYVVDSILPGNYKFNVMVRFDTLDAGKNNRISACFISADDKDTLKVREIRLIADTLEHRYQWSQYVDSVYNRLEIRFLEADNLPKLKFRRVMLWDITLFKPYTAPSQVNRLQANLPTDRGLKRRGVKKEVFPAPHGRKIK